MAGRIKVRAKPGEKTQRRSSQGARSRKVKLLNMDGSLVNPDRIIKGPNGFKRTVPTERVMKILVRCLKKGSHKATACGMAGISHNMLWSWEKKGSETEIQKCETQKELDAIAPYVEVRRRVNEAMAHAEQEMVEAIRDAARAGEWRAGGFLLERRFPQRWAKATEIRVNGEVRHDHTEIQKIMDNPEMASKLLDAFEGSVESTDGLEATPGPIIDVEAQEVEDEGESK